MMPFLFILAFYQSILTSVQTETKIINLGTHRKNEHKTAVFVVTNVGKKSLIISDVKADCQCTVVRVNSRNIKPGNTLKVEASYDNSNFGYYNQNIYIKGNLVNNIVLTLRGKIY